MKILSSTALFFLLLIASTSAAKAYEEPDWTNPFNIPSNIWNEVQRPMRNQPEVVGRLGHNVFWPFCSNNGYQSYYDRGDYVICGHEAYNSMEKSPSGVYFSYNEICSDVYGRLARFENSVNACIAQDN